VAAARRKALGASIAGSGRREVDEKEMPNYERKVSYRAAIVIWLFLAGAAWAAAARLFLILF